MIIVAVACEYGAGGGGENNQDISTVRGHITEVIARNITEIETLRIRDESGKDLVFTTDRFVGFTPSHLKEHQLLGQSVQVHYFQRNGELVAVRIED